MLEEIGDQRRFFFFLNSWGLNFVRSPVGPQGKDWLRCSSSAKRLQKQTLVSMELCVWGAVCKCACACMCLCVYLFVRVYVCACMCLCHSACVCLWVYVCVCVILCRFLFYMIRRQLPRVVFAFYFIFIILSTKAKTPNMHQRTELLWLLCRRLKSHCLLVCLSAYLTVSLSE